MNEGEPLCSAVVRVFGFTLNGVGRLGSVLCKEGRERLVA